MNNDAEAREVHATVTDSEESGKPVNGYQDESVSDGRSEPTGRPDPADEDDELIEPDAVIVAGDSGDLDDSEDPDEAVDGSHPDTVVAEAIVVEQVTEDDSLEPLPGDDTVVDPVAGDDAVVEPVAGDDTVVDPVAGDGAVAEPVAASFPGGPKHAAADPGPARPGMPVNGDVPEGSPMAGDPQQLHERWATIQSAFVDDPHGSVASAADMVTEVIATVVASAKERESGLRGEWDRDGVDTEDLRNALRSYRALLDHLAAL
jgi:hypothetical protein